MVVGPTPPQDTRPLSVAAVRGPGFEPGLLRSTTTQRDGFVNLTDVAPDGAHLLRARPARLDGGPAHGDRRHRRLARRSHRVPGERERGRPLPRRPRRPVDERRDRSSRWCSRSPRSCSTAGSRSRAAVGDRAARRSSRCGCSASSTPRTSRARSTSGATAVRSRSGLRRGRRRGDRGASAWSATRRRPVHRGPRRARHRHRAAPRRPGDRRPPRVEHGVRLLADHRDPLRRPGQHDVLAARRGRGAVRRPARLAGADAARRARRGRRCSRSP